MIREFLSLPFIRSISYRLTNSRYGLPHHVMLEVTTKCNLKCRMCRRSKKTSGFLDSDMPFALFSSIMDNLGYPTRQICISGFGEPLLNPHIFSMIEYASKKGVEVSMTDNFTLVDDKISLSLINSGLNYLYASFDSVSKVEFEKIRNGANFDRVVENIKSFVETRHRVKTKNPKIIFKSTISEETYSEIPKLVKLAEELGLDGIDFGKQTNPNSDYLNDPTFSLDPKDLPKTKIDVIPCEMGNYQCQGILGCFVTLDGKVLPCDHIIQLLPRNEFSRFQLGNLKCSSMAEIWRSEKYRRIRRGLVSGDRFSFCKKCPAFS